MMEPYFNLSSAVIRKYYDEVILGEEVLNYVFILQGLLQNF